MPTHKIEAVERAFVRFDAEEGRILAGLLAIERRARPGSRPSVSSVIRGLVRRASIMLSPGSEEDQQEETRARMKQRRPRPVGEKTQGDPCETVGCWDDKVPGRDHCIGHLRC